MKPLLSKYPNHLIVDAGGWSEKRSKDNRELSSSIFLEGMRALQTQVLNVSGRDMLLGPDFFSQVQESLGSQFLSANIYVGGELFFKPYILMNRQVGGQTLRIGIVGVTLPSTAAAESWPDSEQLEFVDPLQAALQVFETLRPQTDVRILLGNLPKKQLEDFIAGQGFGYDVAISSVGRERSIIPLGAAPVVLGPGPQCKRLGWVNLICHAPGDVEITGGELLTLEKGIADDPEFARFVTEKKKLLAARQKSRLSNAGASSPETIEPTP